MSVVLSKAQTHRVFCRAILYVPQAHSVVHRDETAEQLELVFGQRCNK